MNILNDPRFDDLPLDPMDRIAFGSVDETEMLKIDDRSLCNGITLLLLQPGCIAYRAVVSRLVCWFTDEECSGKDEASQLIGELERRLEHHSIQPHQRLAIGEFIRRFRARLGF